METLMQIIEYVPNKQQYNVLSLHSKLEAAFWRIKQSEVTQLKSVMNLIKIATENDALFHEFKEKIKRAASVLIVFAKSALIDELPIILSIIRRSNISDSNKLRLLECFEVYSPATTGTYNIIHFYPEHWLSNNHYGHGIQPFNQLPQDSRILIMSSRIITQSIYPFVAEINSLAMYMESSFSQQRSSTKMVYSFQRSLQEYRKLPAIATLYERMSRTDPVIYFAALYFEELIDDFPNSTHIFPPSSPWTPSPDRVNRGMSQYNFIEWSPLTIRKIKTQYFNEWKKDQKLQKRHRYDLLTYNEMYSQILDLPHVYMIAGYSFNSLRVKISTIALLETFDACLEDTECKLSYHEYLTKDIMLMHGLDNYANAEIGLCKRLMDTFIRICSKDDLLWIAKWEHPYDYSVFHYLLGYQAIRYLNRFKVWCIKYLFPLRDNWIVWKLKVQAMFCRIDYEIVKALKANEII